jgi:hypothetical protein
VPTIEHFERADMKFGMGYYHWFFLAQPHDRPERMILRDVEGWFDLHTAREPKDKGFFHPEARRLPRRPARRGHRPRDLRGLPRRRHRPGA